MSSQDKRFALYDKVICKATNDVGIIVRRDDKFVVSVASQPGFEISTRLGEWEHCETVALSCAVCHERIDGALTLVSVGSTWGVGVAGTAEHKCLVLDSVEEPTEFGTSVWATSPNGRVTQWVLIDPHAEPAVWQNEHGAIRPWKSVHYDGVVRLTKPETV